MMWLSTLVAVASLVAVYAWLGGAMVWLYRTFDAWSRKPRNAYRWFLLGAGVAIWLPWAYLTHKTYAQHTWLFAPAHVSLSLLGLLWLVLVVAAGPLTWHVWIPLGWVRLAYYTGRLAKRTFAEDPIGGGLLCGALAALRHAPLRAQDVAFLHTEHRQNLPLRGAGLLAMALLQTDKILSTHRLLNSLSLLDNRAMPQHARRTAALWQMAHAATQGDWAEVQRVAQTLGTAHNHRTILWLRIAECFLQPPAERRARRLWWAFWWAGRPRGFATVIRQALQAPEPTQRTSSRNELERGGQKNLSAQEAPLFANLPADMPAARTPSWREAVALQVRVHAVVAPTSSHLQTLIESWNQAWASLELTHFIQARGLVLGIAPPLQTSLQDKFLAEVVDTLRPLTQSIPLEELAEWQGPLTEQLTAHLREHALATFELKCQSLNDRVENKRALPVLEEWREWSQWQHAYETLTRQGGTAVREVAWPLFHSEIANWAVWLWNDRNEYPLGNALFRYLWVEALLVNDEQSSQLHERNLRCKWQ